MPIVTLTPTKSSKLPPPSPIKPLIIARDEKIETPSWIVVKPGEDDKEEAREEMERRGPVSPVRRLRHLPADEVSSLCWADQYSFGAAMLIIAAW